MNTKRYEGFSGTDKAAALLMTLPPEHSAGVVRCLSTEQVERVTKKMLRSDQLTPEVQDSILKEAHEVVTAERYIATGGVEYARSLLAKALGAERAEELINRLVATMEAQPFHYLNDVEPGQIAAFIHSEHPQTIAVILSYLHVRQTAAIVAALPYEMQAQVSVRLANIDGINPAVVAQVETALKKRLSSVLGADTSKTGGLDYLVKVLTQVDRSTERAILEQLDESAPELAMEIRKHMFVFDNLTMLDDRSMQRVLRDVDNRDLALALRGASTAVRDHIFKNVSQRAAETLREELESGSPVRLRTVEEAQQKVVSVVRRLEDEEEIVVARGGSDVML